MDETREAPEATRDEVLEGPFRLASSNFPSLVRWKCSSCPVSRETLDPGLGNGVVP